MNRMKASLSSILEPTDEGIIQQLSRKSIREGEERLLYAMLDRWLPARQDHGPTPAAPVALQPITRLQIPSHITTFWGSRGDAFRAFGLEDAVQPG